MDDLRDFTDEEARLWVDREIEKCENLAELKGRLALELDFIGLMQGRKNPFPRSRKAHGELADALKGVIADMSEKPHAPAFR